MEEEGGIAAGRAAAKPARTGATRVEGKFDAFRCSHCGRRLERFPFCVWERGARPTLRWACSFMGTCSPVHVTRAKGTEGHPPAFVLC